jgi:hypothetical protein
VNDHPVFAPQTAVRQRHVSGEEDAASMDDTRNPRRARTTEERPLRRLVMAVTGLAAVVELFDDAVVELFDQEPDQVSA